MKSIFFTILLISIIYAQPNDSFEAAPKKISQINMNNISSKKISIKDATLKAINELRSKNQICSKSTTPLKWNKNLYEYAKEHAVDMAVNHFLSHNGSGKKEDLTAQRLGLKRGSYFYERVNQEKDSKKILSGELILAVSANSMKRPKDVLSYWINREKDCLLIMDSRFKSVGLSKVVDTNINRAYWVLLLADGD